MLVCLTPPVRLASANGTNELNALDAAVLSDGAPLRIHGNGVVAVIKLHSAAA